MHILFLMTQDLESPGGLGRIGPLARYLVQLGHRVEIAGLHPEWSTLHQRSFQQAGVQVDYVAPMHVRRRGNSREYYGPAQLLGVTAYATLALTAKALGSRADRIHIAKAQPMNGLAGLMAAQLKPGVHLYLDYDDYEAVSNRFAGSWQQRIVKWWDDRLPRAVRGVTVHTTFLRERCRALGVPADRLQIVPNGFDPQRFRPLAVAQAAAARERWNLAGVPIVLYLGSLSLASHPLLLLLDAFLKVRECLPLARLWIVGGGEDYSRLVHEVEARRLEKSVVMTGRVPQSEVPAMYAAADVLVDPVHHDEVALSRGPLKVVEAMACGLPSVTGDVGDRSTLLAGGEAGVLVTPGSVSALAQGITMVLKDPAFRQELSQAALAHIQQYRWDRLVRDFVAVYDL